MANTWCMQNGVRKDVSRCTGNSATCECGTQQYRLRIRSTPDAWRVNAGNGVWVLVENQRLAEDLRGLGWQVQALSSYDERPWQAHAAIWLRMQADELERTNEILKGEDKLWQHAVKDRRELARLLEGTLSTSAPASSSSTRRRNAPTKS